MHGKTLITGLLTTGALLMTVAAVGGEAGAPELNQAQQLVFMDDHLRDIPRESVLNYGFESRVKGMDDVADTVRMTVVEVREDDTRNLSFEFLSGNRRIEFPDAEGYRGNPLIIQFLERDVRDMALATGGSADYFRNRIRKSFTDPQIRTLSITVDGQEVDAVEVIVTPFTKDPNIDKFQRYAQKRYEFVFAEQVPGGLYRIHTLVPQDDEIQIEEQLTFDSVTNVADSPTDRSIDNQ